MLEKHFFGYIRGWHDYGVDAPEPEAQQRSISLGEVRHRAVGLGAEEVDVAYYWPWFLVLEGAWLFYYKSFWRIDVGRRCWLGVVLLMIWCNIPLLLVGFSFGLFFLQYLERIFYFYFFWWSWKKTNILRGDTYILMELLLKWFDNEKYSIW